MRRFIAALLLCLSSPAIAQQLPFTLPANTVIGRTSVTGNSGPAYAIPFSQFAAALNPFFPSINPNVGTFGSSTQCVTFTVTAQGFITAASQTACSTGITQLTGDVTAGPGSGPQVATLASTITAAGPIGSATAAPIITFDAKGRLTTVTSATITPAIGSITGVAAGCGTWLTTATSANLRGCISDETGTGLAYFQGGDIGTPSAGVGTNLTALNASNLSSGTVAAARGGAGTITGALKGNGAGVVSQAACSDLSNGTTNCSAAVGQIPGTATNDNASAGNVGEYVESVIGSGSAIASGATAVGKNVTSISLTAGDWDVSGVIGVLPGATTSFTQISTSVSTTTGTADLTNTRGNAFATAAVIPTASVSYLFSVGPARFSLSTTTTIFLVSQIAFTSTAPTIYGTIRARRVR